jgi:hypothetical protein
MQLPGVDPFAHRQVRCEFPQSLTELPFRPNRIAAPLVIERDREVNHSLEEQTARSALVGPDLLQHFMADEELAAVEEVDAVANARVHRDYGRTRLLPTAPRVTCGPMNRRDLLKTAGAGLTILKSGTLRGQNAPSNKLNVAMIGVWGRGTAHYN